MIAQLDNQNIEVATQMQKVFHASYSVEAKILNAIDFPPLKRTLEEYMKTGNIFYGVFKNQDLAAVVEIRSSQKQTHIQSLVVSPQYFKLGIASQLMIFVLEQFNSEAAFVETGVDNNPAIKLYEKFGFKQTKQWNTDCGIRKVRLDYQNKN